MSITLHDALLSEKPSRYLSTVCFPNGTHAVVPEALVESVTRAALEAWREAR